MYARITFERVEIGKVTQMPQQDDGHIDLSFFGFAFFRAQHDAVFLFDMDIVEIRSSILPSCNSSIRALYIQKYIHF